MKRVKIASHNSFTFLNPKKWYMRPFNFIAKCQSKTIQEQYSLYNVRMFDLRVAFDKHGYPLIKHGLMDYDFSNVKRDLEWLNKRRTTIYVLVILERNKWNTSLKEEQHFIDFCRYLENKYTKIKFLDGRRKYDWFTLYDFNNAIPDVASEFASMKGSKINDLYPELYAKRHNRKAIKNCNNDWVMLDFVEIR